MKSTAVHAGYIWHHDVCFNACWDTYDVRPQTITSWRLLQCMLGYIYDVRPHYDVTMLSQCMLGYIYGYIWRQATLWRHDVYRSACWDIYIYIYLWRQVYKIDGWRIPFHVSSKKILNLIAARIQSWMLDKQKELLCLAWVSSCRRRSFTILKRDGSWQMELG